MKYAFLLSLLLASSLAIAEPTTAQIDAELNAVYQQVLKKSPNPELIKQSQRDWLKFIKSDCTAKQSQIGNDGQGFTWGVLACISEAKYNRTKDLKSNYE